MIDDAALDYLDGDRRFVDAQHARGFTRRGADAPGEFGKVVRGMKHANGFFPAVAVNQIVPIRNDVVHRAARVAEGNAAIHAARALVADLLFGEIQVDFEIVVDALGDGTAGRYLCSTI
mgnify:CR=1 FL=1